MLGGGAVCGARPVLWCWVLGEGQSAELDLYCSTGCWGEGQSAGLDLWCGAGCWREGQLVCGARPVL